MGGEGDAGNEEAHADVEHQQYPDPLDVEAHRHRDDRVGTHEAEDGAGRPGRERVLAVEHHGDGAAEGRDQVQREEPGVSDAALDAQTEDPQHVHVEQEVHRPEMLEGRGHQAPPLVPRRDQRRIERRGLEQRRGVVAEHAPRLGDRGGVDREVGGDEPRGHRLASEEAGDGAAAVRLGGHGLVCCHRSWIVVDRPTARDRCSGARAAGRAVSPRPCGSGVRRSGVRRSRSTRSRCPRPGGPWRRSWWWRWRR